MISRVEITRKAVHLLTLSVPIGYSRIAKESVLLILFLLFIGFLAVDLLRHYHPGVKALFRKYLLGTVLREKEKSTLMGSTYFLFATLLTILFFPKPIAIASLLILILADTSAALIGKGMGRISIFGKTLEGSMAFFLCALLIVLFYPGLDRFSGSLAALGATVIEILPTGIDDNLTIPLTAGAIMFFLGG